MSKVNKQDSTYIKIAQIIAKDSHAIKKKVGAVITRDSRIVSTGYNGTPSGLSNNCETAKYVKDAEKPIFASIKDLSKVKIEGDEVVSVGGPKHLERLYNSELKTREEVIHAEANAILFAAKNGLRLEGCTLFVTYSPCVECAKMIIQSGIKRVVYLEACKPEKHDRSYKLLYSVGIKLEQYVD